MKNVIKAELMDQNGKVIAYYEQKDFYELATCGEVFSPHTWEMDGTVADSNFFAHVNVKWDGCSHIRFYGNDFPNDNDSYYHICGLHGYLDFIRTLAFCYEIMVEHVGIDKIDEKEEYQQLKKHSLLDGFTIRYEYGK